MPSTRIKQNFTVILFFALISISGLLLMAINTGQRFGPLPPNYIIYFPVKDADGLVEGSDVRIAGIPVGKVLLVTTTSSGALVKMGIEPGYPVYSDATVLIRPKSLLGEKYVDMNRGTSNVEVSDGGSLPQAQAFTQVELDQVLQSSDAATRKAVSEDLQNLGGGLNGRGVDLNATIPELRAIAEHLTPVSARFKDRTAQIDHILVDTETILKTLDDEHVQIDTLLQSADAVTGTIAVNDQHLSGLLNGASSTFNRINTVVGQQNNDANIRTSIEQAPTVLNKTQTFLGLINKDIATLVPSLLLGQQYTYPSDQLTVSQKQAQQIDFEWDSAFRMYDPSGANQHGFLAIGVQCDDSNPPVQPPGTTGQVYNACPGTYLKGGGAQGGHTSATAPPAATVPAALGVASVNPSSVSTGAPVQASPQAVSDAQDMFLRYLLQP